MSEGRHGPAGSDRTAPAIALLSAALFGLSTPVAKLLLGEVDAWLLAGLLYLGSGVGLGIWWAIGRVSRSARAEAPLARGDLPWLAAAILAGGVAGPVLLMLGLEATPASSASLLLNLEGLATMAIAWVVFRENVDRRLLAGAAAILAGACVLSWQGGAFALDRGMLLIAGACLAWGIDNNLTRKVSAADPVEVAMIRGLAAGAVNVAVGLARGGDWPDALPLAGSLATGFLGYGVSLALFVLALRHLGTARTGAYFATAPFVGAAAAIPLAGDAVTGQFAAAGILMAVGVWLHLAERHHHEHAHEPMEHSHRHVHDEHHRHDHTHADPPGEPHTHVHRHGRLVHAHAHWPDLHHRHGHGA
jgi:drug/metabolite transporter (DMT)-like permease